MPSFLRLLRAFASHYGKAGGGQGWIRTSVRSRGQIYSLLPLTTRPPVHTSVAGAGFLKGNPDLLTSEEAVRPRGGPFGEASLACQWPGWHARLDFTQQ